MEKIFLLVCEGETDIYIFEEVSRYFSSVNNNLYFKTISLSPQQDATSGSYPQHGYGDVINWCKANKSKIDMLIDFKNAELLFIQMDTDISNKLNNIMANTNPNISPRDICEGALNSIFDKSKSDRCFYILPTENSESWILASDTDVTWLDYNLKPLLDYEKINNVAQYLISRGFPSVKGKNSSSPRKLNKKPATKYKKHAEAITHNIHLVRRRCKEFDYLCDFFK